MLKNIFTLARRWLVRNWIYTSINVIGLTVGIAIFFSILAIVDHEFNFNKNHPHSDRSFRIYSEFIYANGSKVLNPGVPTAVPEFVKNNLPGTELIVPLIQINSNVDIPIDGASELKKFTNESKVVLAGPEYFDFVGQYKWMVGSKEILNSPNKGVLLYDQAKKYFGDISVQDMIGRTIHYNDSLHVTVGGVVIIPKNTDFQFTDIISYSTKNQSWLKSYGKERWSGVNSWSQIFVRFNAGTSISAMEQFVSSLDDEYLKQKTSKSIISFQLQPIDDLHFNTDVSLFQNTSYTIDKNVLQILLVIGFIVLVIAAINFINIMTALSTNRIKEVSMRKTMGSTRFQLILQFLFESMIVTILAVIISIPFADFLMSIFDEYIPGNPEFVLTVSTILQILTITFLIGILSGIYPALVMSSFKPINGLTNNRSATFKSGRRSILAAFQFTVGQLILLFSLITYLQVDYMINKDYGITDDPFIYCYTPWQEDESKKEVFQEKLEKIPEIMSMTNFATAPIQRGYSRNFYKYQSQEGPEVELYHKSGDTSYLDFYDIELLHGRNYKKDIKGEVVVNQTLLDHIGVDDPNNSLGQLLINDYDTLRIVGVIKDFNFRSLHHEIEPMIIMYRESDGFGIKYHTSTNKETVDAKIQLAFEEVYPDQPYESYLVNDIVEDFYSEEKKTADLSLFTALVAIFISCLGMFGLASYATIRRTKEIGIRKVLGASASNIIKLLTSQFLRLVVISILIAVPLAYFLAEQWLTDFAFRIPLSPWIFTLGGLTMLLLAFLTVSYHSFRTANVNPADSLRYE